MALLAGDRSVLPEKLEITEVMVEADIKAPPGRRMTGLALCPELCGMNVVRRMAGRAVGLQRLLRDRSGMACVAGNLFVLSLKEVLGILVVVELRWLERIIRVANTALLPKAAGMDVFGEMASVTVLWHFVFITTGLVATRAGGVCVCTPQGEARLLLVVEARRLPFLGGMARRAVGTAGSAMHIIRRVA